MPSERPLEKAIPDCGKAAIREVLKGVFVDSMSFLKALGFRQIEL